MRITSSLSPVIFVAALAFSASGAWANCSNCKIFSVTYTSDGPKNNLKELNEKLQAAGLTSRIKRGSDARQDIEVEMKSIRDEETLRSSVQYIEGEIAYCKEHFPPSDKIPEGGLDQACPGCAKEAR
jgi:hypothetical protein